MQDQIIEQVRRDDQPLRDIAREVQRGILPAGLIAAAIQRPYAFALVSRASGVHVAGAFLEQEAEADIAGASAAMGRTVVVDASALMVSSVIGEFDQLRGLFPDLLMPTASRADVQRARLAVDSVAASTGQLGWNSQLQQLVWYEIGADERLELRRRTDLLRSAAERTTIVHVADFVTFTELDESRYEAWLAPIELAKARNAALWSDDLAQRRLARWAGVPAFGSLALLELRTQRALDLIDVQDEPALERILQTRQEEVGRQIEQWIVDIPVTIEDVLRQAAVDGWMPAAAAAQLTRPAWWAWTPDPIGALRRMLGTIRAENSEAELGWRGAAMSGVVAATQGVETALVKRLLAALALLTPDGHADVDMALRALRLARSMADDLGLGDPLEQIPSAAAELAALGWLMDAHEVVSAILSRADEPPPETPGDDR